MSHRLAVAVLICSAAGCGSSSSPGAADAASAADAAPAPDAAPDAFVCRAAGAAPTFTRLATNPRLRAGHVFTDGLLDAVVADPDLRWDDAAQAWSLYFMGAHGPSFSGPLVQSIRHATSADGATFSVADAPALVAAADAAAWDHVNTETPSVAYNPDAPADRRYVLVYSGANPTIALPGGAKVPQYAIGAAFSADGVTFTRVAASESPHGAAGLVLTGADAYPGAHLALVADPEIVYRAGTYHLWFSSYACDGTAAGACATTTAYGVGHATSTDAVHWTVDADLPIASLLRVNGDKATGPAQPSVLYDPTHCRWEMWITSDAAGESASQPVQFNNTAGVWHATSDDGATWHVDYGGARDLAWEPTAAGEHLGLLTGTDVAAHGDERRMIYGSFDDQDVPSGFYLPTAASPGYRSGVIVLDVATRTQP